MWETDLIDSVFSPNPQKKSGKAKKKGKDSKSVKIPQSPEKKAEPKPQASKTTDVGDSKAKKKEFENKAPEEAKTETSSVPLKQHNSVPVTRNIPQKESQQKQVSNFKTDYSHTKEQWGHTDHHYKGKKSYRKDLSSENIPQEAVSSFYQ